MLKLKRINLTLESLVCISESLTLTLLHLSKLRRYLWRFTQAECFFCIVQISLFKNYGHRCDISYAVLLAMPIGMV